MLALVTFMRFVSVNTYKSFLPWLITHCRANYFTAVLLYRIFSSDKPSFLSSRYIVNERMLRCYYFSEGYHATSEELNKYLTNAKLRFNWLYIFPLRNVYNIKMFTVKNNFILVAQRNFLHFNILIALKYVLIFYNDEHKIKISIHLSGRTSTKSQVLFVGTELRLHIRLSVFCTLSPLRRI